MFKCYFICRSFLIVCHPITYPSPRYMQTHAHALMRARAHTRTLEKKTKEQGLIFDLLMNLVMDVLFFMFQLHARSLQALPSFYHLYGKTTLLLAFPENEICLLYY